MLSVMGMGKAWATATTEYSYYCWNMRQWYGLCTLRIYLRGQMTHKNPIYVGLTNVAKRGLQPWHLNVYGLRRGPSHILLLLTTTCGFQ